MKRIFSLLVLSFFFMQQAYAGSVPDVTVDELAAMIKSKKVVVIDANGKDTRKKYGTIPGAILLSDYNKYDVAKELPKEKSKKIVFYCANEMCTAAPKAATKAMKAGYTNVAHLSAGIMGWKKAGKAIKMN